MPYPNGEGTGLAFGISMASTIKMPPSLRIIKKEVDTSVPEELKLYKKNADYSFRTLEHWWKQGVFLLNSALTVSQGDAGSHLGQWQWFTREVIKIISINQPCIWMLWGAKAKGFKDFITNKDTPKVIDMSHTDKDKDLGNVTLIDTSKLNYNIILEADHPAAETYPNSKYHFTSCNHFNLCNEILKAKGLEPIKW